MSLSYPSAVLLASTLAARARLLGIGAALCCGIATATVTAAETLCVAPETTLFSCGLRNQPQLLSLCQRAQGMQGVVYRYGTAQHPELTLDAQGERPPRVEFEQFGAAPSQFFAQLVFKTAGKFSYAVGTAQGISAFVAVSDARKREPLVEVKFCDRGHDGARLLQVIDSLQGTRAGAGH